LTLKKIQRGWDKFFVASVITASKEDLYQPPMAVHSSFYFILTTFIRAQKKGWNPCESSLFILPLF
jgi:hypothetical protein